VAEHKVKALLTVYHKLLGYDPPAWGKESVGAKRLLRSGYSHDEISECYDYYKSSNFWKDKHLSLQYIASNIAAWKQEHGSQAVGETDLDKWFDENNQWN
jgi:hypothetical protein